MDSVNHRKGWIRPHLPKFTPQIWLAIFGSTIVVGSMGIYLFRSNFAQPKFETTTVNTPVASSVTALGRLEPQGEVIRLAASAQGSRVAELSVKQGDFVRAGQVIAVLDSRDRLQTALEQADKRVRIAQTKLAQVEAGAKTGEINAQRAAVVRSQAQLRNDVRAKDATVARLEAEVRNAQTEFDRHEALYQQGAISSSLRDNKRLTLDAAVQQLNEARAARNQSESTLTAQVNEAQATLDRIAEVRPVDVEAARAEVESAIVAVKQAQADLDLASIKAPRDGQVIKVHTWAGEVVGNDGIVEIGQTDRMYAVAEVYESDVKHVKPGQRATITSSAFDGEAIGNVAEVGLQIYKKNVLNTDPTAAADARVVEVKIQLDEAGSRKVAGLTNLEVNVNIARNNP